MSEKSNKAGLKLNIKKTFIMTTGQDASIKRNCVVLKMVDKINFLGVTISKTSSCTEEIKRRIILGKAAMKKCNKFIKDSGISIRTKIKLIQVIIFPIVLYGWESWTLKIADKRKIDAFEMWTWRRVLKVTWLDRRTNVSILQEIKPSGS